jgi:ubiquinone/menaquinone biosynthesis C-methylase UbiE
MDFLPADQKDLQLSSYWKKFFEFDRFKDGFEWYASFEDLQKYLSLYIKERGQTEQTILVPGCGNSDLSEKLLTKLGVSKLKVHSVDYEEAVVTKMEQSKPKDLALSYAVGDVTNLKDIAAESYDFAVDKGTLDAIAVDDKKQTVSQCNAYFQEMTRVLNKSGVFMIVSLLQPHVLKIIIDHFVKGEVMDWLFTIKIYRIEHIEGYAEKQFIKYFVAIKKNAINTSNEKHLEMRTKMQDIVFIKDGLS